MDDPIEEKWESSGDVAAVFHRKQQKNHIIGLPNYKQIQLRMEGRSFVIFKICLGDASDYLVNHSFKWSEDGGA